MIFFLSTHLFLSGCLPHAQPSLSPLSSLSPFNKSVEIPIFRSSDNGERIFVSAELPGVGKQYFMVDTGSSVSAIRADLIDEMELYVERKNGYLSGVSGRVPWLETIIPEIKLGTLNINKVAFAVAVEGLPTQAGLVPIAGILGNNIWDQYTMDIDYGLERIQLHPEFEFSDSAQKVTYDGQHILAPVELQFSNDRVQTLIANVDTGSSGLILNAIHAPQLLDHAVQSKETIMGVGADRRNMQDYVLDTHSVNIDTITLGGLTQDYADPAILLSPSDESFISLIGHQVLDNQRVIIGYKQERLQMEPSTNDLPVRNLHQDYLQSIQWKTMSADVMTEIQLHFMLNQEHTAVRKLRRLIAKDDKPQYRVALANYHFQQGDLHQAILELEQITPTILEQIGLTQALILSYIYTDQLEKAQLLLEEQLKDNPTNPESLWVQSLWLLMKGDVAGAKTSLYRAQKETRPDQFLVHKALLKLRSDDISGAISALRMDIQHNPLGNHSLWFLAQQSKGTPFESVAKRTIEDHLSLENSRRGALDFLAAALWELGDTEKANTIAIKGKSRDCSKLTDDSKINCEAWYDALIHQDLEQHIVTMEQVVRKNPGRSDFADTLAVLYRANGEIERAISMSKQAMIFSGSDPYMIWQALSVEQ